MVPCLCLAIAALGAHAVFVQRDAAQRAALHLPAGLIGLGGHVHAAGKGQLDNVQLVLEQVVDNFNGSITKSV